MGGVVVLRPAPRAARFELAPGRVMLRPPARLGGVSGASRARAPAQARLRAAGGHGPGDARGFDVAPGDPSARFLGSYVRVPSSITDAGR